MICPECGAQFEDGQPKCPECFPPARKPGLLARLVDFFRGLGTTRTVLGPIKMEQFTLVDLATGSRQDFNSMEDVPPEIRAKLQEARAQGKIVTERISFTFRGVDGQEQTYHSLEEMPPAVRTVYEQVVLPEIRAQVGGFADQSKSPDGPPSREGGSG